MSALTVEPRPGWWPGVGRPGPGLGADGRTRGQQGGDHRGDRHRVAAARQHPQHHRGPGSASPVHRHPRGLGHLPDARRRRPLPFRAATSRTWSWLPGRAERAGQLHPRRRGRVDRRDHLTVQRGSRPDQQAGRIRHRPVSRYTCSSTAGRPKARQSRCTESQQATSTACSSRRRRVRTSVSPSRSASRSTRRASPSTDRQLRSDPWSFRLVTEGPQPCAGPFGGPMPRGCRRASLRSRAPSPSAPARPSPPSRRPRTRPRPACRPR